MWYRYDSLFNHHTCTYRYTCTTVIKTILILIQIYMPCTYTHDIHVSSCVPYVHMYEHVHVCMYVVYSICCTGTCTYMNVCTVVLYGTCTWCSIFQCFYISKHPELCFPPSRIIPAPHNSIVYPNAGAAYAPLFPWPRRYPLLSVAW